MNAQAHQDVVLREQVAALYASSWSSTLADTLLAWGLCAIFYWRLQDPLVLVWAGLHFLQLLRYPLLSAYHRDPQAAQRSEHWARLQCRELTIYSTVWGLAPWLFLPANDLPMTVLLMLVILGLCSGGVPAVAPRWRRMRPWPGAPICCTALWRPAAPFIWVPPCTLPASRTAC